MLLPFSVLVYCLISYILIHPTIWLGDYIFDSNTMSTAQHKDQLIFIRFFVLLAPITFPILVVLFVINLCIEYKS